jgi:hypothetical protein
MAGLLISSFCILSGCGEGLLTNAHKTVYGGMEIYKERLEAKLLRQYKNHPEFGRNVNKVKLEVVRDIKSDESGKLRKVEFSQLVYDIWGERIPELEKEYFVITFGPQEMAYRNYTPVRPKINVGLNTRGSYSELERVRGGAISRVSGPKDFKYCPVCGTKMTEDGICPYCMSNNNVMKTSKEDTKSTFQRHIKSNAPENNKVKPSSLPSGTTSAPDDSYGDENFDNVYKPYKIDNEVVSRKLGGVKKGTKVKKNKVYFKHKVPVAVKGDKTLEDKVTNPEREGKVSAPEYDSTGTIITDSSKLRSVAEVYERDSLNTGSSFNVEVGRRRRADITMRRSPMKEDTAPRPNGEQKNKDGSGIMLIESLY